jgi:hypothetical protein
LENGLLGIMRLWIALKDAQGLDEEISSSARSVLRQILDNSRVPSSIPAYEYQLSYLYPENELQLWYQLGERLRIKSEGMELVERKVKLARESDNKELANQIKLTEASIQESDNSTTSSEGMRKEVLLMVGDYVNGKSVYR